MSLLTSDDRAIRSLASPPSGWSWMESQESEVGVRGRDLCDLWPQKLMLTSASAASRSWYSMHGFSSMVAAGGPSIRSTWGRSGQNKTSTTTLLSMNRNQISSHIDSWRYPARYLETSRGEVTYYNLNPEDTRTQDVFRHELCKSSSTRRRPSSPEDLEPPRVSKVTSSSSSCSAPPLHPEIFVFFQFHVRHVLETSSTRPLAHWDASTHCPAVSSHGLTLTCYTHVTRRLQEKIQNMSRDVRSTSWTCHEHVRNTSATCHEHVGNMSATCHEHVGNTSATCHEHVMNTSGTRQEHVMNTSGTRQEHIMNMSWTRQQHVMNTSGTCQQHVMNTSGTRQQHVMNTSGTRQQHVMNTSETRQEHVRNTSWTCHEHVMNMSWTRHEHIRNTSGTRHEHVMNTSATCHEHVGNTSATCHEHIMNTSATHHEHVSNTSWTRLWFSSCLKAASQRCCRYWDAGFVSLITKAITNNTPEKLNESVHRSRQLHETTLWT